MIKGIKTSHLTQPQLVRFLNKIVSTKLRKNNYIIPSKNNLLRK